jgi:hypothetical protein
MPQYPPVGPGYYPAPPENGFGVAAFVVGLIGLLFSFIPIIGVIAWPLVLLALVFAALGLARVRAHRANNKGLTIAGLVCALFGLAFCILYAAAFTAAISASPSTAPRAAYGAPAPAVPAGPRADAATAGTGDEVQDGSFAFTVTDVETDVQALGESFLRTEAQGIYVLVHVTVRNVGSESQTVMGANQTLLDTQGREFAADSSAALMNVPDSESLYTPINPGNGVDGVLVFDVPEGLTPAAIELHESMFSGGRSSQSVADRPVLRASAAADAATTYSRHGQCGRPRPAPSEQRTHRPSVRGTCSRSSRCQTSGSPSARTRLITTQAHRRSATISRMDVPPARSCGFSRPRRPPTPGRTRRRPPAPSPTAPAPGHRRDPTAGRGTGRPRPRASALSTPTPDAPRDGC